VLFNLRFHVKYLGRIRFDLDMSICKWMLKLVPTFAGISIFSALFNNVGMLVLSKMKSMEEVGIYGAALRLIAVMSTILQSYKSAIQPAAAQTFESRQNDFGVFCARSIRLILLVTVPVALGTTALSGRIIQVLYGSTFSDSAPILSILMWSIVPYGGMMVLASFLISSNNQKIDLRVNVVGTMAASILSFALIPSFGATGAAVVTLASTFIFLSLQMIFIHRRLFRIDWFHVGWKILVAGILMGAALSIGSMPLGLEIALGALVYFTVLVVLKEPAIHEFKFLHLPAWMMRGFD
jgi:O-antigen/teichoic acid export membrane protein